MNKFFKLKVILPIILGIIIGGLLFAFGEYDDAVNDKIELVLSRVS